MTSNPWSTAYDIEKMLKKRRIQGMTTAEWVGTGIGAAGDIYGNEQMMNLQNKADNIGRNNTLADIESRKKLLAIRHPQERSSLGNMLISKGQAGSRKAMQANQDLTTQQWEELAALERERAAIRKQKRLAKRAKRAQLYTDIGKTAATVALAL
ncbi:MAG: hypothetical protein V1709_08600 [Planctomycetota bacterium]